MVVARYSLLSFVVGFDEGSSHHVSADFIADGDHRSTMSFGIGSDREAMMVTMR